MSDVLGRGVAVKKPQEAALDAKLVTSLADIGQEKSRVLVTDANNFSTTDLARRVVRNCNIIIKFRDYFDIYV